MSKMTKREYVRLLVDKTEAGLLPAVSPEGIRCVYRVGGKKDGRGCPFGVLIPDDDYDPEMETKSVTGLQGVKSPEWVASLIPEGMTVDNMVEVQVRHDRASGTVLGSCNATQEEFRRDFFQGLRKLKCLGDCLDLIPVVE